MPATSSLLKELYLTPCPKEPAREVLGNPAVVRPIHVMNVKEVSKTTRESYFLFFGRRFREMRSVICDVEDNPKSDIWATEFW